MLSIDITDKQLKLVKGQLAGSKIRINDVGTRDVPDGSIVNGYITNIPLVAGEITDMLSEKKIADKEITVCINSSSILYKELEVLKPKSLKNTAAIEAMIIAQMGIANDYNISYSVVGEGTNSEGAATIKVMATACPQRMVDGYQALFSQLGLKLTQINISNNCITRLILNTPKLKEVMPFLCIQVDVDFININLYENGQVALSRYIKIDPSDYENNPDYINIAVFDNLFRMIQFIGQRPGSKPLKQIMFYGMIKDFVALSNSILSFNIPAHVLAMPNNIVKFCEVDFSRYANAIGAFYKVDPMMEHINLLQSKAVTSKKGADLFPMKILGVAAASVVLVFVVQMVLVARNDSLIKQKATVEKQIAEGNYEAKRAEIDKMQAIQTNFINYKYSVKLAKSMYEFLPRGNLPQIKEYRYEPLENLEQSESFITFHDVVWSMYSVTFDVYCEAGDIDFPAAYVEALNDLDFFDGIVHVGFETLTLSELQDPALLDVIGNREEVIKFSLSMRLRGGHIFDEKGDENPYNPGAYAHNR